jgi:hypothetical protein
VYVSYLVCDGGEIAKCRFVWIRWNPQIRTESIPCARLRLGRVSKRVRSFHQLVGMMKRVFSSRVESVHVLR